MEIQRHIVEIRDRRDESTRQYVIESTRNASNQYNYALTFKSKWEKTEQLIVTGEHFGTSELAVEDALVKIEAWERWLDASRSSL